MPVYMFNGPVYPPIVSGSGYVLSRSAAECIYKEALYIPYFHLEVIIIYYMVFWWSKWKTMNENSICLAKWNFWFNRMFTSQDLLLKLVKSSHFIIPHFFLDSNTYLLIKVGIYWCIMSPPTGEEDSLNYWIKHR